MTSRHREMATWYKDVLGLTQSWESETAAYLHFADSVIAFSRVEKRTQYVSCPREIRSRCLYD